MSKKIGGSKFKRQSNHIRIHYEWFDSPAYRSLSLTARCLLNEFLYVYRPSRNGHLVVSVETAAKRLNKSEETCRNAYYELMETGFLVLSEEARYINGRAREFRLTIYPSNNGREPTDDWQQWTPDNPIMRIKRPKKKIRIHP
ncbi:MAG: hypothetical protein HOE97_08400 [Rhodospirillaceae bacterium]|jgi:hypothetical protein|nr:hypothetical protein [Rhodospirillaceae bacterium]